MNWKRLITGLSLLCILTGVLLVCFATGGFLNRIHDVPGIDALTQNGIWLGNPGPVFGFILVGLGAVGFVVVFSMNNPSVRPREVIAADLKDAAVKFSAKGGPAPQREDKIEPHD